MEIRRLVEEIAADKYPDCDYVRERVQKELDFLERTERFKEIETLVEVKELVGEKQFFVSEGSLLVLYLLGLSVVNPMPAHYYNRNTKEIIFDGSKNYGDLIFRKIIQSTKENRFIWKRRLTTSTKTKLLSSSKRNLN